MKWYSYLICVILIISGVFCGINLHKELNASSYINGSVEDFYNYGSIVFYCGFSNVSFYDDFYDDSDIQTYDIEVDQVNSDFDASKHKYRVYLNDFYLYDTVFNYGTIKSKVSMDFHDIDGATKYSTLMEIDIAFYNLKTKVKLTVLNQTSAEYLQEYFANDGFKLKVVEVE